MSFARFKNIRFTRATLITISHCNSILSEYQSQGFVLTLRQLYYQFIARDLFPETRRWRWTGSRWVRDPNGTKNALPNYKYLAKVVSDGRLAGVISWAAIEDRVRNLVTFPSWNSPKSILHAAAESYQLNPWMDQDYYIEVWIEKDALIGVVEVPCDRYRVPHFASRGYNSQSEMYSAAKRFERKVEMGKLVTLIYLGDHDPSGIDMSRDIQDRLSMFLPYRVLSNVEVLRLALTYDQVESFNPPPSPAKTTDTRSDSYIQEYGEDSWELDALDPTTIDDLISTEIRNRIDMEQWDESLLLESEHRDTLRKFIERMDV